MKFDLAILSSVLHELEDPRNVLLQLYNLLKADGQLVVIVPNNQSIHRLISKIKNSKHNLNELTKTEIRMQQTISFSPDSLTQLLTEVGFNTVSTITSFIKPLPHQDMENAVNSGIIRIEHLDLLFDISQLLDGYGSEIFGVAKK